MRPRLAVFSGPTATVLNTPPLRSGGGPGGPLRAQRLAAPATVYVEAFSAHPLERDAASLYAAPDGYVGADGAFRRGSIASADGAVPAYEVELRPEDGLFLLPYVARRTDGAPWEADGEAPEAPETRSRQPFFPDAARLFEEIDRFGLDTDGRNGRLADEAEFEFFRAGPPGGYRAGRRERERTDEGPGDIPPERSGEDYFPYRPRHLRREPHRAVLATITNRVQRELASGKYDGLLWLEGSPFLEETLYWFHLTIDTGLPIAGVASPDWAHGVIGNVGDRNVLDAVRYLVSRPRQRRSADPIGPVLIHNGRVIAAREVEKTDARGPGYGVAGGVGGILGAISQAGDVTIEFEPARKHTGASEVRSSLWPALARTWAETEGGIESAPTPTLGPGGELEAGGVPRVTIVKYGRYSADGPGADPAGEVEVLARIRRNLAQPCLAGFVAEGGSPHGHLSAGLESALQRAVFRGMPVVKVGRGSVGGFVPGERVRLGSGRYAIAGANLTATKARMLLAACLLRFGPLPVPADPEAPTAAEREATSAGVAELQRVFDSH